ncbi:anti-sigma factor [Dongia sedimenti]|uniref:Regulator of SigK n=1 Tax=Dongia sedimenti TaxID=3064282 RepID=A0ABU0YJ31_9PROT|nr:anti-sigma factor [Rhodospirillaceae bacterium R-7]
MTDTSDMTPGPGGEDRDTRLAEYVLGTLVGDARAAFEAELVRDESLRRAVAAWSERLQPLADSVAPVAPPLALRDRILASIGASEESEARFGILRWLAWTFGASAVAAAVAVAAVFVFTPQPAELGGYAMLKEPTISNSVVVFQIDKERRQMVLLANTPPAGAGKDYELWVLPSGKSPVSLGVLKVGERIERPIDQMRATLVQPGTTLAVSLEPAGGSASGAPTGPVLFTGVFHLAGN